MDLPNQSKEDCAVKHLFIVSILICCGLLAQGHDNSSRKSQDRGLIHTESTLTPVCNSYVTALTTTRSKEASQFMVGTTTVTFSSGKNYAIHPYQYEYTDSNGTFVVTSTEPDPYAFINYLTASYLNKKNVCITVDADNEIQSVGFQ